MHVDMRRLTAAALEAAIDGGSHDDDHQPAARTHNGHKHTGLKAMAAGAALATVARVAIAKRPSLPRFDELLDLKDDLLDRLAEQGWIDDPRDAGEDDDFDEPEAEYEDEAEAEDGELDDDEDERDFDEPEAEYDDEAEDDEADDDDEPEAEYDDDYDDEDADAEESPGLDLDASGDEDELDPAARPPEPPKRASKSKSKAKSGRS